jgi:phospholysine phosphohistidine inorganic pyrophosphate phosphatase
MPGKPGVRGLLVDLDGVLYDAERPIAGAVDTVRWLQTHGISHLFVTNTTSKPRAALAEKLASFGIPAGEDEILTPAVAAAEWLRVNGRGEIALFVRR